MQLNLFVYSTTNLIEELFQAYFDCRKNKRNTYNALAFEQHFEENIFRLYDEISSGIYQPGRSIAFIVNKPVKREIFAADFKDRVVHHWLINKINPLFELEFIEDSFACRIGKGTHFGVQRLDSFIKACSENYTEDCYVLKLDIQGFFMHIHKGLLYEQLKSFMNEKHHATDKQLVMELCHKIIFNDPTLNCIIKGSKSNWEGLPKNKSLFHSPPLCGLPIGNLTSQVFANFYMNTFDQFMKNEVGIQHYGRYVDDFVVVHNNKEYLKSLISVAADFLKTRLQLILHPKKIYMQHYSKGVKFLGTVIKSNRIYIANRTKSNFYAAIQKENLIIQKENLIKENIDSFLSTMNSYLGIMKHYKTYKLRKRILLKNLNKDWWNYVYKDEGCKKLITKKIKPQG